MRSTLFSPVPFINTAAKRLRMRQVGHFRSLSDQRLPAPAHSASFCSQLVVQVVLLHAARVFDYFVVLEVAF